LELCTAWSRSKMKIESLSSTVSRNSLIQCLEDIFQLARAVVSAQGVSTHT